MQIILLQKVQNLGDLGDIVNVKPGFARNYLIPQGKAAMATADNIKAFEARKAELEIQAKESLAAAQARAESLQGLEVSIVGNASPEGKLYGSIGPRDIAGKLTENGFPVDKSEVIMGEGPLRELGEYEVVLNLHPDVDVTIKLKVEGEE